MTPDGQTVERVARAIDPEAFGPCPSHWAAMKPNGSDPEKLNEEWKVRTDWRRNQARKVARAAISAMPDTTQARNDALREAVRAVATNGGLEYTEDGFVKWRLRTCQELAAIVADLIKEPTP